jgi:hypothetical protein
LLFGFSPLRFSPLFFASFHYHYAISQAGCRHIWLSFSSHDFRLISPELFQLIATLAEFSP